MKINFTKVLVEAGALGAGGVAAKLVGTKVLPNIDPKLKNLGLMVIGIVGPSLMGGGAKGEFVRNVGKGITAVAAANLVGEFLPGLTGLGDLNDFNPDKVIAGEETYNNGDGVIGG